MPTFTRVAVFNLNNNFVVVNTGGQITYSSDGINWTNASVGTGQTLRGAAFGLSTYIVVGDNGFMARATDLGSWQTVTTGTTQNLKSIEFGAGQFRAVGDGGVVLTSTDGTTFSSETSGTTQDLKTVRYTNSRWIALGTNGTLITNTGSGWTNPAPVIDSRPLYGIAYKAGMTYPYCAGKKVSTDGVNWTSLYDNSNWPASVNDGTGTFTSSNTDPFDGYIYPWKWGFSLGGKGDLGTSGVRYPGQWYEETFSGYDGKVRMPRWSFNGSTWERYTINYWLRAEGTAAMTFADMNGALFCFPYEDGITSTNIYGSTWFLDNGLHVSPGSNFYNTYWGFNSYPNNTGGQTPIGGDTSLNYTYASNGWGWGLVGSGRFNDGTTQWEVPGESPLLGAYGNGYYILLTAWRNTTSTPVPYTTSNWQHEAWRATGVAVYTAVLNPPAWRTFNRSYVAPTATVKWPIEQGTWSNNNTYTLLQADMCFGAGIFAAVGPRRNGASSTRPNEAGTKYFTVVYSSDNGVTWNDRVFTESAGYDVGGRCAGSANEIVMSAKWYNNGTPGWVLRTTDCVNYTAYYTGYNSTINEIKYCNGFFYTVHDNGGIARSSNGVTWTTLVAGTESAIYGGTLADVYFINSQYIVSSAASTYQTTSNLALYTNQPAGAGSFLYWDGSKLITCWSGNQVRTSTNGTTWTNTSTKPISSIAVKAGTYIAVQQGQSVFYRTTDLVNWTDINLNTLSGVGVIIRDSAGLERLQSYDPSKSNYLCTRVIQENYVTADNTTIYVPAANGYKIFVMVTPADSAPGGRRIPYIEYKRGGAPDYTPYFIVRYPAWGGSGSVQDLSAVWCTVFTTGVVERVSY